ARWEAHKSQVAAANELAASLPDTSSAPSDPAANAASSSSSADYSSGEDKGTLAGDESLAALRDKLNSAE
ncbi:MAG: 30S ribosomal protein S1, partial [Actinomycetes bacterium]